MKSFPRKIAQTVHILCEFSCHLFLSKTRNRKTSQEYVNVVRKSANMKTASNGEKIAYCINRAEF